MHVYTGLTSRFSSGTVLYYYFFFRIRESISYIHELGGGTILKNDQVFPFSPTLLSPCIVNYTRIAYIYL